MLSQSCSKRFKTLFSSFNLHQLITVPTRPISGSIIDHIYITHKDNVFKSGTLPIGLSDHLPIFVTWFIRGNFPKSSSHKSIFYRSLKDFSADNFVADLNNLPWNTMEMFTDVNEALENW